MRHVAWENMDNAGKEISPRWWGGLIFLFCLIYLPNLGIVPLSRLEAIAALGSVESGLIVGSDHGAVTYPLYPMLVGIVRYFAAESEWAVRLPSTAAVLGTALLSGFMARRMTGERLPAVVAFLMAFLPVLTIIHGRSASGHAVTAFFLTAAWFAWYWLGRCKHRWGGAWAIAVALVLIASFHTGLKAFVIFYFPLFFLRRPFYIWQRLRMPRHLILLFVSLVFFSFWLHGQMGEVFLLPLESALSEPAAGVRNFFLFPLRVFVLFLPAPLLFWPGFCAAFRAVEKNREFASFLRTLTISLFLAVWFIPHGSPADLLVLAAPLAVLAGMHYEILLRRYRYALEKILPGLETIVLSFSLTAVMFWSFVLTGVLKIAGLSFWNMITALLAATAVSLAMLVLCKGAKLQLPVWLRIAAGVVALHTLAASGWLPVRAVFNQMGHDRAVILRENLPEDAVVYNLTSRSLAEEFFYLQRPVVSLESAAALPVEPEEPVMVLGGYNPPLLERFSWSALSELVDTTVECQPVFEWFPDHATLLRVGRSKRSSEQSPALVGVRIYKGVPRPEPEAPESDQPLSNEAGEH